MFAHLLSLEIHLLWKQLALTIAVTTTICGFAIWHGQRNYQRQNGWSCQIKQREVAQKLALINRIDSIQSNLLPDADPFRSPRNPYIIVNTAPLYAVKEMKPMSALALGEMDIFSPVIEVSNFDFGSRNNAKPE